MEHFMKKGEPTRLHASGEDYLEAILILKQKEKSKTEKAKDTKAICKRNKHR